MPGSCWIIVQSRRLARKKDIRLGGLCKQRTERYNERRDPLSSLSLLGRQIQPELMSLDVRARGRYVESDRNLASSAST